MFRLILLTIVTVLMSGCFSSMSYQTADTLKKGEVEVGVAADAPYLMMAIPEVMVRAGLGDNVDGGIKLYGMGTVEADLKFRVSSSGGESDRFSVALQPGIGVFVGDGNEFPIKVGMGVLLSKKMTKNIAFYGAGRLNTIFEGASYDGDPYDDDYDDDDDGEYSNSYQWRYMEVGGTIGLSFDYKHFWLRTELTAMAMGTEFGYITPGLAVGFKF